jgi:hypothetical protein
MIVTCPSCEIPLDVPETLLGRTVRCASCANTFSTSTEPSSAGAPLQGRRPLRSDEVETEDEAPWARGPRRDLLPHRGGMILTLGIISVALSPFALCSIPGLVFGTASLALGITGLVLGQADLRRMRTHRMDPDGRGTTNAGWICAIIGTCISSLAMACVLFLIILWHGLLPRM